MSKSTYKKWIKESFLYEADKYGSKSVGKEDGDTWDTATGRAGKYKGKVRYFDGDNADDDADNYAKSGKVQNAVGDDDKEKKTPVSIDIDAGGGLGGDEPFDPKSDGPHQGGSHFDRNDIEKIESPEDLDDWIKDNEEKLNDEQREQLSVVMDRLKMAKKDYADDPGSYRDEVTSYWGTIEKIADMTRFESIKVINGKKYKAIKESVNKKVTVKEIKSWMKSLEEFRYRKIPNVDARRITSFVNNGLSETDLPQSLQKKWGNAKYSKEKGLADRFMKERINKRLTQNESKHPIKERYDRLFKNKVVL